jgi:hypothetical protein
VPNRFDRSIEFDFTPTGDEDLGPLTGKPPCSRETKSAAAAGNECHFVDEFVGHNRFAILNAVGSPVRDRERFSNAR